MKPIDCLTDKGTIKVYAKWLKAGIISADSCEAKQIDGGSYNVKYNTNGGNTISSVKVAVGAEPTQFGELPIPKKDGYTFAGWYYDSDFKEPVTATYNAGVGKVEIYKDGNCEYARYKDVTLYAKWVEKFMSVDSCEAKQIDGGSYNVKYNTNGGNTISSVKVAVGAEPTQFGELPISTKEGYTFGGWYYDANFNDPVAVIYAVDVDPIEVTEENGCVVYKNIDRTLYARWQKVYKEKDVELIIDEKMASNINRVEIKQLSKEDKSMILLNKKLIKFNAYEINLLDANNSKIQPNGKVILKFPFDKSININHLVVYRVDGDKLVPYNPIIIDGYAQIETDHFGIYAVGEEKSVSNPETSDNILIYVSFGILFVGGSIIITKKLKYSK